MVAGLGGLLPRRQLDELTGPMGPLQGPMDPNTMNPNAMALNALDQRINEIAAPSQPTTEPLSAPSPGLSSLVAPYQSAVSGAQTDVFGGGSGNDLLMQALQNKLSQRGGGGGGGFSGPTGGFQFGDAFSPKQDLITKNGVTLQRSAMQNLLSMGGIGRKIIGKIGGGYRDLAAQARAYAAYQNGTGNMAARPGHSFHNYGLAFDLAEHIGAPMRQALLRAGWRNDVPGEWWHWSIGQSPWGGN